MGGDQSLAFRIRGLIRLQPYSHLALVVRRLKMCALPVLITDRIPEWRKIHPSSEDKRAEYHEAQNEKNLCPRWDPVGAQDPNQEPKKHKDGTNNSNHSSTLNGKDLAGIAKPEKQRL